MKTNSKWTARTPDISAMVEYWDKTDAIVTGYDAVRNGAELYLPKFADELDEDYKVRLKLTKFTNIYRDVLEGLATKPFEDEIHIIGDAIPESITDFAENVDGSGNNLTVFGAQCFFNGVNSSVSWIFIDYPTSTDQAPIRTIADQKRAGVKPYWTLVLARNVLEVRSKIINGKEVLSYIRVLEPGNGTADHVRIFERTDGDGVTWKLMQESQAAGNDEGFVEVGNGKLSVSVIPMVPFTTGRRDGKTWKFYPVMRDAADLQITLYQDESALQFIKTMAGYPMLSASGVKPEYEGQGETKRVKKVAIGPQRILYAPPDGQGKSGEWKYIEPTAQSMEFLQKNIDATKQDLRELGRQPLTAQSGNITAITSAVAAGKARSAVSSWALNLKDALENALMVTKEYLGETAYEPEVSVYTDVDNITEEGNDVDALLKMRENGDLSQDTLYVEMKRRKILSPEFDTEKEKKLILAGIPVDDDVDDDDPKSKTNPKPKQPA